MSVTSTPLSSSEAVLWMIERDPVLRSTIVAVAVLDGPPDLARLSRRVELAANAFPRLHQRVAPARTGVPRWTDAPGFDVEHHLTHVRLPRPGSRRQLLDLASEQAGAAFDPARPLWHLTVVDGLKGGQSALIVKLHHAVTDGVGGIGLLPIFTDTQPGTDQEPELGTVDTARRPRRQPRRAGPFSQVASVVRDAATDPAATLALGPRFARSTAKFLAPATEQLSPVTTARGLDRRLATLDVPLADLAGAGKAVGGTLNDAFLAAVVGGLHRYHQKHGRTPEELRVTMPISFRRHDDEAGGNRFTPARFAVPLTIDDPVARMQALGQIVRSWRQEPAIRITDVLAGVLSHLPDELTTSLFGSMLKGVDFVATNVPGSPERRWLAGAEVLNFYGFGPTSGAAVSFALVSNFETCGIGINADAAAIPDADVLLACLEEGFAEVIRIGEAGGLATTSAVTPAPPPTPSTRPAAAGPARLSALDATFLEAETPHTPLHVGALLLLEGEPLLDHSGALRIDEIRAEIAAHLPRCPRMLQRVAAVPFGRPAWEDDSQFDLANHVHRVHLPAPGTRTQLEQLCSELQMAVLDRSRPLWEMWFVDGLEDGSVGLVYKVHHAVVDGVSAAETFEALLAEEPPRGQDAIAGPRVPPVQPSRRAWLQDARAASRWFAGRATELLVRPGLAVGGLQSLAHLATPSARKADSSLNGPVGASRRLVSVSFEVADLKVIGRRHNATVNDIVLTLVAAGMTGLLKARGDDLTHLQVLVPVSRRGEGGHDGTGNKVAALFVPLPVGDPDPVATLHGIAADVRERKAGSGVAIMDLLLRWSDTLPMALLGPASRQLVNHQPFVHLVVTNVRGSTQPLSLLGAQIKEIVPIVPLGGNLTLGVAVLSYAGHLVVGVHADADACADVGRVTEGIEEAYAQLRERSSRTDAG